MYSLPLVVENAFQQRNSETTKISFPFLHSKKKEYFVFKICNIMKKIFCLVKKYRLLSAVGIHSTKFNKNLLIFPEKSESANECFCK